MNRATTRFALRRQRLELGLFGLVLIVLGGLAAWLAFNIFSLRLDECYSEPMRATAVDCEDRSAQLSALVQILPIIQALAVFAPPVAGLFLGSTIVAREVESGTAMFAWSFGTSRTRWLLGRILPAALALATLALVAGSAVDAIYAATYPYAPLEENLIDYQVRGPLLMARAMLAFSAALLVGAAIGRLLPALLLSLLVCAAVVGGSMLLTDSFAHRDPIANPGPGSQIVGVLFKTSEGEILDQAEAMARLPRPDADPNEVYTIIDSGIPGVRSVRIVAPAVSISLIVAGALVVGTLVVTSRRRPY